MPARVNRAFSAGGFFHFTNPGALPQASNEKGAFGAKQMPCSLGCRASVAAALWAALSMCLSLAGALPTGERLQCERLIEGLTRDADNRVCALAGTMACITSYYPSA